MMKSRTFKYGSKNLNIIGDTHELVPASAHEIIFPSDDCKALALAIAHNLPALLIGDTGTGKTSIVKYLAHKLEQPYVRVNMTGFTSPDELIGSKSVKDTGTYFEDGIITNAMRIGAILVIDEINATAPDCLFIIHGLLDDDKQVTLPNGEVVKPHPNFRVFATMNPDYEGTKGLNRALLDRFNVVLEISGLSPQKEAQLLIDRNKVNKQIADDLVKCGVMARKAYTENKTLTYISTRSLLQWSSLITQGLEIDKAFQVSICAKANREEQEAFRDIYNAVFKLPLQNVENTVLIITQKEVTHYETQIKTLKDDLIKSDIIIREKDEKLTELLQAIAQPKMAQLIADYESGKLKINVGDVFQIVNDGRRCEYADGSKIKVLNVKPINGSTDLKEIYITFELIDGECKGSHCGHQIIENGKFLFSEKISSAPEEAKNA